MVILFFTFVLMPVLVFFALTVQQWLFKPLPERYDLEWELYQQRYD